MTALPTIPLSPATASVAPSDRAVWGVLPLSDRLAWLRRFRCLVAAHQQELCQLMEDEVRKPLHEGLLTDVAPLLATCTWLEKHGPRLLREREMADGPFWLAGTRVVERRLPLGRVGIIATWNYPVQLLGIQLVHALLAGNTVVVKPSEKSPRTQQRLLELAVEARLPHGTLVWVGSAREAGAIMLATQKFDHVVFTGSTEVGQRVATMLAKTMTPATLELSGRDSAFVLEDADVKHAARALWAATCVNAGQTCMGPRRALVHAKVYDAFVKQLSKLAAQAKVLDLIDEPAAARCRELVTKAIAAGARDAGVASEGAGPLGSKDIWNDLPQQRRFRPMALLHCTPTMEVVEGRHFGPLLAVVRVASVDEALSIHKSCDQHLSVSIFTRDHAAAQQLAPQLGATSVMINDAIMPTCHPAASIGGRGPSGQGLSRGEEGLLGMTRPIYISTSTKGIAAMHKPLPTYQVKFLAKFLRWWYGGHKAPKPLPTAHVPTSPAPVTSSVPSPIVNAPVEAPAVVPVFAPAPSTLPITDGPTLPALHKDKLFSHEGLGEAYTGRPIDGAA
jgi:acyl-CoA reductase-like NAD-dependent aldehyde dehydrogenase